MNPAFLQFKNFIGPYGLNESDFNTLIQFCEIIQFKNGDIVMKDGEVQNSIYFISKGLIRYFILSNNAELKTYGFRMENMLVTGYAQHNYTNNHRSEVNIECLEHSEMLKIPFTAIKYLEENSKVANKVGRYLSESHIIELVKFIKELDTKTIIERYDDLDNQYPNIHQRVPQHIIASYLRTSAEHLSRLKKARIGS